MNSSSQQITVPIFLAATHVINIEQANALASIRFTDTNQPILTFEDKGLLYEIIWLLKDDKGGFNVTYQFLNHDWAKTIVGPDSVKRKAIILMNPLLENASKNLLVSIEKFNNTNESHVGLYKCIFCKSENTIAYEMQIRSADEPAKITVKCNHCIEGRKGFTAKN